VPSRLSTYKKYTKCVDVTGYGLNNQRLIPGRGGHFLFAITSRPVLGTLSLLPKPQRILSWRGEWVKSKELEADHSPPSSAKVKNVWSYTSTLLYVLIVRWFSLGAALPFTFTDYHMKIHKPTYNIWYFHRK